MATTFKPIKSSTSNSNYNWGNSYDIAQELVAQAGYPLEPLPDIESFFSNQSVLKVADASEEYPCIYIRSSFVTGSDGEKSLWDYSVNISTASEAINYFSAHVVELEKLGIKKAYVSLIKYNPNNKSMDIILDKTIVYKTKNKVYLNGPNKNNDFLKKKGKHF